MMLWRAAALMAITFCMTGSQWHRSCGASLPGSVNEPTFRDVCSRSGKWFLGRENCFVEAVATKHSGRNCEYFQGTEKCWCFKRTKVPSWDGFFRVYGGQSAAWDG